MPLLLGSRENEVFSWRATQELQARLKEQLDRKCAKSSAADAERFLASFVDALAEEVAYEDEFDRETAALEKTIAEAAAPQELQPVAVRCREVAAAHFTRRNSVLALCAMCCRLHDALLARVLDLAEERMRQLGQGSAPICAVLISGDRGRDEETLYGNNRYLLLHELDSPRFYLFCRQVTLALKEAGLLASEEMLWHGSLVEWRALLSDGSKNGKAARDSSGEGEEAKPEWKWRIEAMADLRYVTGYEILGGEALKAAAAAIAEQKNRDPFLQVARRVITLPLALGHFGRWRLVRSGEHKGEIDIEELALLPLMMTVRAMSVQAGVHAGGTLQRIRALMEQGILDVDLAGRLFKAFRCFMQLRIESEIRTERGGAFANPEEFDVEKDARVREAVEAVLNLQKIAYQRTMGQG